VLDLRWSYMSAAGLAILLALAARFVSISMASLPLHLDAPYKLRSISLLTWSGLRGGISVALALSLPDSPYREALVTVTYGLAVFTMVVQGLTLRPLAMWLYRGARREGGA
jgi:CPA1 family monovalent cation:H+ antiporter